VHAMAAGATPSQRRATVTASDPALTRGCVKQRMLFFLGHIPCGSLVFTSSYAWLSAKDYRAQWRGLSKTMTHPLKERQEA
jgi:hypothetical protein